MTMNVMPPWPYPFWIAHRGAGKLAPENTLAAFRAGSAWGYRAFECDVKLSRDGVPFLLHDASLNRTTNGDGAAADHDWQDLSQLDAGAWHGRAFAGETLATFQSIARHCLAHGHCLNIEIKPSPGRGRETGAAVAQAAAFAWGSTAPLPLLSSFDPDALESARSAQPQLPRALLVDSWWGGWLARAQALGCVAVIGNHQRLDAERIAEIHGAGLRALAYTVNEATAAQALIDAGIDGLITDAVDRFAPALGRAAATAAAGALSERPA